MIFAWVEGMRGPTPQVWGDDYQPLDMQKRPRSIVLQQHDMLPTDRNLTLDELMLKYPLVEKTHEV